MKHLILIAALALPGCAHSAASVLAQIDTSTYALPTDTGQYYALRDHRGHVVVLQFFATWCVPCLAQVNQLEAMLKRHPQGLDVAGIAFDLDAPRSLPAFRATAQVSYPLLIADAATRSGESVFGKVPELPTTVVIDREGVVRGAFFGLPPDDELEKLLREAGLR